MKTMAFWDGKQLKLMERGETGHFKQQKITTVSGSKRSCLPSKMRFTLPANWGDKIIQDHTRSPCRDVLKQ